MLTDKESQSQTPSTKKDKLDLSDIFDAKEAQVALKSALKRMEAGKSGKEQTVLTVAHETDPSPRKWSHSGSFCTRLIKICITTACIALVFFGVLMAVDFMCDRREPINNSHSSPLISRLDKQMERLATNLNANSKLNHIPIDGKTIKDKLEDMNDRLDLVMSHLRNSNHKKHPGVTHVSRQPAPYGPMLEPAIRPILRGPPRPFMHPSTGHMQHLSHEPAQHPFREPIFHSSRRPGFHAPPEPMMKLSHESKIRPPIMPSMLSVFRLHIPKHAESEIRRNFVEHQEDDVERFGPDEPVLTITIDEVIGILKEIKQKKTIPDILEYLGETPLSHKIMGMVKQGRANLGRYIASMKEVKIGRTIEALEELSENPSKSSLENLISMGESDMEGNAELNEVFAGALKTVSKQKLGELAKIFKTAMSIDSSEMGKLVDQFNSLMPLVDSLASGFYDALKSDQVTSDLSLFSDDALDLSSELQKDGQQILSNLMHSPRGKKVMKKFCNLLGEVIEILEQAREDSPDLSLTITANADINVQGVDQISADTLKLMEHALENIEDIKMEAIELGQEAVIQTIQSPVVIEQIISKVGRLSEDMDVIAGDLDEQLMGKTDGANSDKAATGMERLISHITSKNSPVAPMVSALVSMSKQLFEPQQDKVDIMKAMAETLERDQPQMYEDSEDDGAFTDLADSIMGSIYGDASDPTETPETESEHKGLIEFFGNEEAISPSDIEEIAEIEKIAEESEDQETDSDDSDLQFVYTVTSKPRGGQLIDTSDKLSAID